MGEGADAVGERGCEGSAGWGEVVDDDLGFGKNWVSWVRARIGQLKEMDLRLRLQSRVSMLSRRRYLELIR